MALSVAGTVRHTSVASGATISIPTASTTVGDVLILELTTGSTNDVPTPVQSGWTALGSSPISGNSGAAIYLWYRAVASNDPANWTATFSVADSHNGSITAITGGADLTNPILQNNIATSNTNNTSTTQTTTTLVPNRLNCLPLAFFGAQNPNGGTPGVSARAANWTETYIESAGVATGSNTAYHATEGQVGPLTADMSTPISASATWAQYTDTHGFAVLLLIQPAVVGNVTSSPASGQFTIVGTGVANAAQLTVTQSGTTSLALSNQANAPGQVSFATTQTGTYTPTITAAGPTSSVWCQLVTAGDFQINVQGT